MSGETDEWFTPVSLLLCLPRIALDPCYNEGSDVVADQTICLARGEDGLDPWPVVPDDGGIIFVNPPYSDCARWLDKVAREAERQAVPILVLVPAKAGEAYWARSVYRQVRWAAFFAKRLSFVSGDKTVVKKQNGTFGSALLCYSSSAEKADALWDCLHHSADIWPMVRTSFGQGADACARVVRSKETT